jgi:hypothetical protein
MLRIKLAIFVILNVITVFCLLSLGAVKAITPKEYDQTTWITVNVKCHDSWAHLPLTQRVLFCEDQSWTAVGQPERSPLNK